MYALRECLFWKISKDERKVGHAEGFATLGICSINDLLRCARLTVPTFGLGCGDDQRFFVTMRDHPKFAIRMHVRTLSEVLTIQAVLDQYRVHEREAIHVVRAGNGVGLYWLIGQVGYGTKQNFHCSHHPAIQPSAHQPQATQGVHGNCNDSCQEKRNYGPECFGRAMSDQVLVCHRGGVRCIKLEVPENNENQVRQ